ncbi:hypothetical protein D9M73_293100 [compost metagenome]
MGHRIGGTHPGGVFADHHAQGWTWLQAFTGWVDHIATVGIAGVRRLDEEHRLDWRLLVRRLFELGQTLL